MLFKNYDQIIANGQTPLLQKKRKDILEMLTAAVEAVDPYLVVERVFENHHLVFESESFDLSSFDHVYVVGFGKASVGMARAVCDNVPITKGMVITNDPSVQIPGNTIDVLVGGHPLPTQASVESTEKILNFLKTTGEHDAVIVLISGGGSTLFCQPRVPLEDLQITIDLLLKAGVTIQEMNTIRKHLSFVKGGQMIPHMKGVVFSLIISDIVGDPINAIASGPTSPDPTTFIEAKCILEENDLWDKVPSSVRTIITDGVERRIPEMPKEDDSLFKTVFNYVIANNERACRAAAQKAKELGYEPTIVTTSLTGEAKAMGSFLVEKAKQSISDEKTVFIFGGETTVHVKGQGRGGRNQEIVLSCVERISKTDLVFASFATDGIDGNSDAAGAIVDGQTLSRAHTLKLDSAMFLKENNSHSFFSQLTDTLITGSTGTNVMDIQIIIR